MMEEAPSAEPDGDATLASVRRTVDEVSSFSMDVAAQLGPK
jgi:hypothetical protein